MSSNLDSPNRQRCNRIPRDIETPGVKYTFLRITGQQDREAMLDFLCKECDITRDDLTSLFELDKRATEDLYEKLKRLPAEKIPDSALRAAKAECKKAFSFNEIVTSQEMLDRFDEQIECDFEGLQGDTGILKKVSKLCIPYIRVRAKRLMQAFKRANLFNRDAALKSICALCFNGQFTDVRYTATVLAYAASGEFARKELNWLLRHGGCGMSNEGWIKATKKVHEMTKVYRMCMHREGQITAQEMVSIIYPNNLAGRDHYMTDADRDEEISNRKNVPEPYKGLDEYLTPGLDKDPTAFARRFIDRFCHMMGLTGKLKKPVSWNEFGTMLYMKMPGGSVTLPKNTDGHPYTLGDLGKVDNGKSTGKAHLSGNKRLYTELIEPERFENFGHMTVTAFLKYEVAKNRWLYPADYDYNKLALYIMDHMESAFASMSGVDYGHDLEGGVATKMDVHDRVQNRYVGLNTDGSGFNESHNFEDMELIYNMIARTIDFVEGDFDTGQELQRAVDKYVDSIKHRTVRIPKLKGTKEEVMFEVFHTLFSGEGSTQLVNTGLIGGLAIESAEACATAKLSTYIDLFWKGDDLNGFFESYEEAMCFMVMLGKTGFISNSAKDHIEMSQSEHERCIVTPHGYNGSLFRRVGSLVCAEPQGSINHTLVERLTSLNESRVSMNARGANSEISMLMFEAGIMTRLRVKDLPENLIKACGQLRCIGGFGLWFGCYRASTMGKRKLPGVDLNFSVTKKSTFCDIGSAHMTDPVLRKIELEYNLGENALASHRPHLIGDSVLPALGGSRYGDKLDTNDKNVLDSVKRNKFKSDRNVSCCMTTQTHMASVVNSFGAYVSDSNVMRHRFVSTLEEIVAQNLSRSGCLQVGIYAKVHSCSLRQAKLTLANSSMRTVDQPLIVAAARMDVPTRLIFIEGQVEVCPVTKNMGISEEMRALVSRYVVHMMTLQPDVYHMANHYRPTSRAVELSWIASNIGLRIITQYNSFFKRFSY